MCNMKISKSFLMGGQIRRVKRTYNLRYIIIQEKSGNEKRLREDVKTTTIKKHDFMLLQVLCFLEVEFKHLLEYNDV